MKGILDMKKIVYWIEVFLWCGVIFFFSSIPDLKIKELGFWDFVLRKIAHIFEYFVLSYLLIRAFEKTTKMGRFKSNIFSIFLGFIYAVSDEIHQYFVPGRYFSLKDILIDLFGILFGVFFYNNNKVLLNLKKKI